VKNSLLLLLKIMFAVALLGVWTGCDTRNKARDAFAARFVLVGQVDGPIADPEYAQSALSAMIEQNRAIPDLADNQTLIPDQASTQRFSDDIPGFGALDGYLLEVPLVPREAEWRVDEDGTVFYRTKVEGVQTGEGEELEDIYDWQPAPTRSFIVAQDGRVFRFRYAPRGKE
jgi:hypothetical protein